MNNVIQAIIAIGSVGILLALMKIVNKLARDRNWSAEVQRKLVHVGTGLYALTLPWLFTDDWPVLMLLGLTLIVMYFLRRPKTSSSGLGSTLHGVGRKSYGDILFALAIGTVYLLAGERAILYVLPMAILTLSDAAAALTGSIYGKQFFKVDDCEKTVEGSVTFFVTTFCVSMICLLVLSDTPRVNVIYLSAVVAAFGTMVEADSWRGFDNFFLPVGLFLFLEQHLTTPPLTLFTIMVIFFVIIGSSLYASPKLQLSDHTTRVYNIAAFLLLTTLDLGHTILPLLILLTHAICHRYNPCDSEHPELDAVAGVALFSIFWLVLGRYTGKFNIPLYGLTAMSLVLFFVVLMIKNPKNRITTAIGVFIGAVAVISYLLFFFHTSEARVLMGMEKIVVSLPIFIGAIVITTIPALLMSETFKRNRVAAGAGLSMILPLICYTTNTMN